jgi:hypothetical protein
MASCEHGFLQSRMVSFFLSLAAALWLLHLSSVINGGSNATGQSYNQIELLTTLEIAAPGVVGRMGNGNRWFH